ncbi:hypothetical protein [Bradyrhizobium canariense]|uniref:Uncharacterized protein n=1 Tax=Bradyrhizobium canariense TaxID=255045 RepID=A0A1H2ALQ3_9BRAD|nr:hypothetical protein [Bradyrhizobium canariense]SDT46850.1 hypothetical protein SAMN05444158_6270 [Bradyrhizobium canariense]
MGLGASGTERHIKTLRAWQLALLRFVVTLDNADRLAVFAIAGEIDKLSLDDSANPGFRFFRKTSADLCASILDPNEAGLVCLRQYLARIDDERLKRIFAAAIGCDPPEKPSISRPAGRTGDLWRGLASRTLRTG